MLISTLKNSAQLFPQETAFIVKDSPVSWQSLEQKVSLFLKTLSNFSGQRIILRLDSCSEDDIAMLVASSDLNMETILVSSFHSKERALQFLEDFDADKLIAVESGEVRVLGERNSINVREPIAEPYICVLTSGTTGAPKCAKYSWERISGSINVNPKFQNKRWFMGYHITNFAGIQVFLQCFVNRGCLVISGLPASSNEVATLIKHNIQYLNCTPTYARKLLLSTSLDFNPPFKSITMGGEVVDQQLIDALKKKMPEVRIIHIYASTELGASIEVRDELEGFPIEMIDEKSLKVQGDELFIKASGRSMLNYLDSGAALEKSGLTSMQGLKFSESPWIPTGDLVEIVGSRVKFRGRRDLTINVGGFKVNPLSVESVVREVGGVKEVIVSGKKNPVTGNLLVAKILIEKGLDKEMIKKQIIEKCNDRLTYYSVPRLFEFTEELTYTSSFKLQR